MVLKKSKIKIPYIRLNFRIVRQSDVRWCGRSVDKIIIYLLPDWRFLNIVFATLLDNDFSVCLLWLWQTLMEIPDSTQASASLRADTLQLLPLYYVIEVGGGTN